MIQFLAFYSLFLTDRQQRVALNGQLSNWKRVIAGSVLQGSILGPFMFLI